MRRHIKVALCVRVAVLLVGPGLYCLLTNIFVTNDNNAPLDSNAGNVNNSKKYTKCADYFAVKSRFCVASTAQRSRSTSTR